MELIALVALLVIIGLIASLFGADTRPADTTCGARDW